MRLRGEKRGKRRGKREEERGERREEREKEKSISDLFFSILVPNTLLSLPSLLSLCSPVAAKTPKEQVGSKLREASMHGNLEVVKKVASQADVNEREKSSGRTALHKVCVCVREEVGG